MPPRFGGMPGLAAVPGQDPVAVVGGDDQEGLEHADLADRGGELVEVAQVVAHVVGVVEQGSGVDVDEGCRGGGIGHGGSFLVVGQAAGAAGVGRPRWSRTVRAQARTRSLAVRVAKLVIPLARSWPVGMAPSRNV